MPAQWALVLPLLPPPVLLLEPVPVEPLPVESSGSMLVPSESSVGLLCPEGAPVAGFSASLLLASLAGLSWPHAKTAKPRAESRIATVG